MLQPKRLSEIRRMVRENDVVTVLELSNKLNVSPSTIRRDLKMLQEEGMVGRFHGGVATHIPRALFSERELQNKEEKRIIGIAAAELIKNGDTIILDAGTTVAQIAKNLGYKRNVSVVTTTINIARLLEEKPGFKVILTGGLLSAETDSLVGVLAKQAFDRINADKAFLGCEGISIETGLMYPDLDIAEIKRAIIDSAKEVILVADHTKFDKVSLTSAASVKAVDKVITDDKLPQKYIEALKAKGVEVIIASKSRIEK